MQDTYRPRSALCCICEVHTCHTVPLGCVRTCGARTGHALPWLMPISLVLAVSVSFAPLFLCSISCFSRRSEGSAATSAENSKLGITGCSDNQETPFTPLSMESSMHRSFLTSYPSASKICASCPVLFSLESVARCACLRGDRGVRAGHPVPLGAVEPVSVARARYQGTTRAGTTRVCVSWRRLSAPPFAMMQVP